MVECPLAWTQGHTQYVAGRGTCETCSAPPSTAVRKGFRPVRQVASPEPYTATDIRSMAARAARRPQGPPPCVGRCSVPASAGQRRHVRGPGVAGRRAARLCGAHSGEADARGGGGQAGGWRGGTGLLALQCVEGWQCRGVPACLLTRVAWLAGWLGVNCVHADGVYVIPRAWGGWVSPARGLSTFRGEVLGLYHLCLAAAG